jgi:hypothetical protein
VKIGRISAEQPVLVLAGVTEAVVEEVDGAALPGAAEHLRDRGLQTAVSVGDGDLDADQGALDQSRRNAVQNASVSASPTSIERISRGGEQSRTPILDPAEFTRMPPSRSAAAISASA